MDAITVTERLYGAGQFQVVTWASEKKPSAANKGTTLVSRTRCLVRSGVDFANMQRNEGRETGPLPWGEWANFPFIVRHNGADYVRLYPVRGLGTRYFANGDPVDRETFASYLTPSAAATFLAGDRSDTITVKAANIISIERAGDEDTGAQD